MSAYVVSYETLNKILAGLNYTKYHHDTYPHSPREILGRPCAFEPEDLTRLGREMLLLNVRAIQCRYEDQRPLTPSEVVSSWLPGNGGAEFVYVASTPSPKVIPLYKALQCFIYQCSEGSIVSDSLYKELDIWLNSIGHFIVSNLPEYTAADWG